MNSDPPFLNYERHTTPPLRLLLFFSLGVTFCAIVVFVIVHFSSRPGAQVRVYTIGTKINDIQVALEVFETDNGRYPTTAEGLAALFICPPDLTATWKGPYGNSITNDKWGHPFIYRCPSTTHPNYFDLFSAGPDGIPGTPDDVTKDEGP